MVKKINECEDERALNFLKDKNLQDVEFNKEKLTLLWDCCQIPDFVKKTYGNHTKLLKMYLSI